MRKISYLIDVFEMITHCCIYRENNYIDYIPRAYRNDISFDYLLWWCAIVPFVWNMLCLTFDL